MEIRAIAPNEWKYTYSQSMQLEGQTGNIALAVMDFIPLGTTTDRNGKQTNLRPSWTMLSTLCVLPNMGCYKTVLL